MTTAFLNKYVVDIRDGKKYIRFDERGIDAMIDLVSGYIPMGKRFEIKKDGTVERYDGACGKSSAQQVSKDFFSLFEEE